MFVDEIRVVARAGHGGRGCVSLLREAYRPKGGPDGGNGGRGGDVVLEANHDLNNLIAQFYQSRLFAGDGEYGMGKGMDGRAGRDLVVKVPCGTLVWKELPPAPPPDATSATDSEDAGSKDGSDAGKPMLRASGRGRPVIRHAGGAKAVEVDLGGGEEAPPRDDAGRELVVDLTTHGQQFVLCRGGRGGLGNSNFANSVRQTPRFAQPGEPGGEGVYLLELRLMADVGLVGYPNAGKSTLLTAISMARPKIAPYPFTTLTPQVGIVEYPNFRRLVVCDVPGLIEGAHRNVGLGHAFLRHIERCSFLVIVLDMAGTDGREPWDDYRRLLAELEMFDPALVKRRHLVAANKMDEPAAAPNLKKFRRRIPKVPILQMSAAFDGGIEEFKRAIGEALDRPEAGATVSH